MSDIFAQTTESTKSENTPKWETLEKKKRRKQSLMQKSSPDGVHQPVTRGTQMAGFENSTLGGMIRIKITPPFFQSPNLVWTLA